MKPPYFIIAAPCMAAHLIVTASLATEYPNVFLAGATRHGTDYIYSVPLTEIPKKGWDPATDPFPLALNHEVARAEPALMRKAGKTNTLEITEIRIERLGVAKLTTGEFGTSFAEFNNQWFVTLAFGYERHDSQAQVVLLLNGVHATETEAKRKAAARRESATTNTFSQTDLGAFREMLVAAGVEAAPDAGATNEHDPRTMPLCSVQWDARRDPLPLDIVREAQRIRTDWWRNTTPARTYLCRR